MLFYYFKSKLGLYEYLCTYASEFMRSYFGVLAEQNNFDYLEHYRHMVGIKLQAYQENPYIFEFYTMLLMHPENLEVSETVASMYEEVQLLQTQIMRRLYEEGNTSLFREDMKEQKIKDYISWFFEGYSQNILTKLKGKVLSDVDLDPYWAEYDEIMEDLKILFYKNS